MKYFKKQDLAEALVEAGLLKDIRWATHWLRRREVKGILVCPRDPSTGIRMFTEEQIPEIVKAFSPGGSGNWKASK